jgi:general secretion pathway protein F
MVEALDLKDAREKLGHSGVFPDDVQEAGRTATSRSGRASAPLNRMEQRAVFYRALAALTRAGLPLATALEVQLEGPAEGDTGWVGAVAGVRDAIREGASFTAALHHAAPSLTAFEQSVLESGEKTARLPEVLERVADTLDEMVTLRQTLRSAAIYPLVIVGLAVIVGVGVMGFLVPRMASVFTDAGMALPWITRVVVGAGHWFLPVVVPVGLLGGAALALGIKRVLGDDAARMQWEQRMSRLPGVGRGMQLLAVSRFARTAALLLGGGVPLVDTVELAGRATGLRGLAARCNEAAREVRNGAALSRALASVPLLGAALVPWIRAGEAAGDLAGLFAHAGERYQRLWTESVRRAVTLIEPALIIVVAVFVLLVALAILLPILTLNQQLV